MTLDEMAAELLDKAPNQYLVFEMRADGIEKVVDATKTSSGYVVKDCGEYTAMSESEFLKKNGPKYPSRQ